MGTIVKRAAIHEALNERLARIIAIHFDPQGGTPYWLERQRALAIDAQHQVRGAADLAVFGPMDQEALARRPVEDFIPRSLLHRRPEFMLGETAGTLGRPKYAVHRRDEFHRAFVEPFLAAAARVGFPRGLNWLFIGPSGPHIIGKAANACANAMAAPDCFTIDLDPRWAKKLPSDSFGLRRYVAHLEEQALTILDSQHIGVIFSTPVVLESLIQHMDEAHRQVIRGIHLGGLSVSAAQHDLFRRAFPNAVILSGYGNTLFGMMPELAYAADEGFSYYPHGQRLIVRVVPLDGENDRDRLHHDVPYGERGQVVISRLDETQLILNMMERDSAVRLPSPTAAANDGFVSDGVQAPQPIANQSLKPAVGLY